MNYWELDALKSLLGNALPGPWVLSLISCVTSGSLPQLFGSGFAHLHYIHLTDSCENVTVWLMSASFLQSWLEDLCVIFLISI